MEKATHPFYLLRRRIRQAGQQYRHNNDNSDSLFHPAKGFVYAYDIVEVERALDAYEEALGSEYRPPEKTPEELLMEQAEAVYDSHPSVVARNLAAGIIQLLGQKRFRRKSRRLKVLTAIQAPWESGEGAESP